ncbi:uncharacterized protein PpBr36_09898 [Pyricularia pennisetigena]|uniref:uncharacterized protein n=1 Tax=Pyricularia pennisetigena TaxID=1578925 RepID=UPI0011524EDC|nr:uncharacterized protein PpBr36_09898 [Pyricularia pennisetigena]TLS22549.1 hypothetical protein PpBr36_09898 [Pyricularia pennisetigena]
MYLFRFITLSWLFLTVCVTAFPIFGFLPPPILSKRSDSFLYRGTSTEEGKSVIEGNSVVPKGASHPHGPLTFKTDWETLRHHVLGRLGDNNNRSPFISTTPSRRIAEGFVAKSEDTREMNGSLLMIDRQGISEAYSANREFQKHGQVNPFGQQMETVIKGEIPSGAIRAVIFYNNGKKTTQQNPNYLYYT